MNLNEQKDHFSRAVVRAIAATVGVKTVVPELDEDSLDITFIATDAPGTPGARLDAQLKCSQNLPLAEAGIDFPLPVKNYNDLRWPAEDLYVPRILIVVRVPDDPANWLEITHDQIALRHCAYWASLAGAPPTANTSTVTVKIAHEQVFDTDALRSHLRLPGTSV